MTRTALVTVVTGGGRGIGLAIATGCAARGDTVWVIDVGPRPSELPAALHYYQCDVRNNTEVTAASAHIIAQRGCIDFLVNNAGITADGLAVRLTPAQWTQVLEVNLTGSFFWAQACLRQMVKQRSGYIVQLSSIVASTGNAGQANYAASKAGIEALTKSLAREYGPRGILVNAIAPGFIATPMTDRLPENVKKEALARTALQRAGTVEEVAALALFLSSGGADYITGQIIHINGGMW